MSAPRVAFQGEVGAYSEEAAYEAFSQPRVFAKPTFEAVFDDVESGSADFGILPIENTLFGSVHVNYDLLREHDLKILGEVNLRIRHNLLALRGVDLEDVRRVLSHPQALGQCKTYLQTALSTAELVPVYDTAGAAKMIAGEAMNDAAAVASAKAAEEYGLDVLASGIESNHQNYTRFLVIGTDTKCRGEISGSNYKTSIVYALDHAVAGALFKSLAVFALRDVDLMKIESRPLVGTPGSYLFYLDIAGHEAAEPVQRALEHLSEIADLKVLGSYPIGSPVG